jgi:hypothetical protein
VLNLLEIKSILVLTLPSKLLYSSSSIQIVNNIAAWKRVIRSGKQRKKDFGTAAALQRVANLSDDFLGDLVPRADGGKDVWLFLAVGFIIKALVWSTLIHYHLFY